MAKIKKDTRRLGYTDIRKNIFLFVKKSVLISGVILLFGLLITSLLLPKDQFQTTKEAVVKNPRQTENYLHLADQLLDRHQFAEAEKIIQVLGESDVSLEALQQKKATLDPREIQKLIDRWEAILAEKPDYRDGYLQLAKLYWQIFNQDAAQANLQKALELDPNYLPALELQKIIL